MKIVPAINIEGFEGSRTYDIYSLLLKERIILITGEINEDLAEMVVSELLYLHALDNESPINIYINSPGGEVTSGFAIYDMIKSLKCPVKTIGLGLCASMGAFLLAAGSKGYRTAYENTEIMIHQPLGQSQGQVSDIEIMTNRFLKLKQKINEILACETGQDIKKISIDTDRNYFLDANEALKYGLIDYISKSEI